MPWLGRMPAASTSEGVGDRVRGVRSAVAMLVRAVWQHWARGGGMVWQGREIVGESERVQGSSFDYMPCRLP
jgi:hypothetical protein